MPSPQKKPQGGATYRFIGDSPEILANGRPVEPGEMIDDLMDEEMTTGYNTLLAYDGKLIGTNPAGEQQIESAKQRGQDWIDAQEGVANPSYPGGAGAAVLMEAPAPEQATTDETKER